LFAHAAHATYPLVSLKFDSANSPAWIKYAKLESRLQDFAHTRAIYELGVSRSPLSIPELLWKVYIDFETEEGERDSARWLYEWLISLSGHVKVWTSYVLFEAEPIPVPRAEREEGEEEDDEDAEPKAIPGDANLARQVFGRGNKDLKSKGLKSEVSTLCCDFVGFHFSRIALCLACGSLGNF
jgi:crooked neck